MKSWIYICCGCDNDVCMKSALSKPPPDVNVMCAMTYCAVHPDTEIRYVLAGWLKGHGWNYVIKLHSFHRIIWVLWLFALFARIALIISDRRRFWNFMGCVLLIWDVYCEVFWSNRLLFVIQGLGRGLRIYGNIHFWYRIKQVQYLQVHAKSSKTSLCIKKPTCWLWIFPSKKLRTKATFGDFTWTT